MARVLLATTNPAKLDRLRWLVEGTGVEGVAPGELPHPGDGPSVAEEGRTHLENARAKAVAWSRWAGMPAVASDGGLVVPVLGELWEPLLTGRFAGAAATDLQRLDRLLDLMRPHTGLQRAAWWVEALALAQGDRVLASWEVESPRGLLATAYDPATVKPGFWAFSLWYLPRFGKCHVQLSDEELAEADDHWARLRALVGAYFRGERDGNAPGKRP